MTTSLIISPDRVLTAQLKAAITETPSVSVAQVINHYPEIVELSRAIRTHAAQLVFVTTESVARVVAVAERLEQVHPGIQVVAVGPASSNETLTALMRAGIREFLVSPIDVKQIAGCLARTQKNLKQRPVVQNTSDRVYSFLPAKPGVGASTLAVNASLAMAVQEPGRTLLADLDLNSGIVGFLLKLDTSSSTVDVTQKVLEPDDSVWAQRVSKAGVLDVLHAGVLNSDVRLQSMHLHHLVDYVRRNYKAICFDLSGNLEKHALEVMQESRRIFIVTTSEPCSLYLAREKVLYLSRMGLGDRVAVLLNRHQKRFGLTVDEVESLIGTSVFLSFPNDYARLSRSILRGVGVDPASEMGRRCAVLASYMLEQKQAAPQPAHRRFVDYFSISPERFAQDNHEAR